MFVITFFASVTNRSCNTSLVFTTDSIEPNGFDYYNIKNLDELNTVAHIMSPTDFAALEQAKSNMQNISWAMRNVNKIGDTVDTGVTFVPEKVLVKLQSMTQNALLKIIKANLLTIQKNKTFKKPSKLAYKSIVTGSGALSGFFGATSGFGTAIFASELALTTNFLMRTIMDIARSEGEDIYTIEGQMACLEVFALGGASKDDDSLETSYYTTRIAINSALNSVSAAGVKVGLETLIKGASTLGSGVLSNFVSKIAIRLSLLISEKFVAQALPVVGAIGGGGLNYVFVNHFQKMATAHFTIKRLERQYGEAQVKLAYDSIKVSNKMKI